MEIQKFENNILKCSIDCVIVDNNVWFRGKDVAIALGYENTTQAIIINVEDEDKHKLEELWNLYDRPLNCNEKNTIYINESGLYSLILRSKKEEAKEFKKWITKEVLPSIRQTGTYKLNNNIKYPQMMITNETDLHYNIIKFIKYYFDEPIIIASLGENQITSEMRIDSYNKGYIKGAPDILLLNYNTYHRGLAIELKSPKYNCELKGHQKLFLESLENNKFKTIVSNDYNELIKEIIDYHKDVKYCCKYCSSRFKNVEFRNECYIEHHSMMIKYYLQKIVLKKY
jgi:prophage antirepressor-like protein